MARPTESDTPGEPPDGPPSGSAPADGKRARHRALLVEDHPDVAEALAELMRLHGLEVSIATSGREALRLAGELNPVLVLCDLWLPDMTGFEVAQTLRAQPGAKNILVVLTSATSANALSGFEGQMRASGIDLFLPKPLTSENLIALCARLDALRPSVSPTGLT